MEIRCVELYPNNPMRLHIHMLRHRRYFILNFVELCMTKFEDY
jgi:hypothetical protein